jgi:hypothetical protein
MLVGAAGFEPTTTSPPGLATASANVRRWYSHPRTGQTFGSADRGCSPPLLPALLPEWRADREQGHQRHEVTDRQPEGEYRWTLEGPGLGEVEMADVGAFLTGITRVVQHACGHAVGREVKLRGRREQAIERASKIRLTAVESGSVTVYGNPAVAPLDPGSLNLDTPTISELGLQISFSALGRDAATYPDVAGTWVDVGDELGIGKRFDSLRMDDLRSRRTRTAVLDGRGKERLRMVAAAATLRSVTGQAVTGRLFEADFERRTAKLRAPAGGIVTVEFPEELDDDIQRALRRYPALSGEVKFNPKTNQAVSVRVRRIDIGQQMAMFGVDFWNDSTIADLRTGGGRPGVTDPEKLRVAASDDEWAAFFEAVGERH